MQTVCRWKMLVFAGRGKGGCTIEQGIVSFTKNTGFFVNVPACVPVPVLSSVKNGHAPGHANVHEKTGILKSGGLFMKLRKKIIFSFIIFLLSHTVFAEYTQDKTGIMVTDDQPRFTLKLKSNP